jgi:DNA-binding transcriptional ArsR family regulator
MRPAENVLAEVPCAAAVTGDMTRAVLDVLRGKAEQWVTSGQLAIEVGAQTGYTQPAVRRAIAILLESGGVPVVASDKGYMFTTDDQKLRDYIEALAGRVRGIQARIAAVQRILTAHSDMKPVAGTFDEKQLDDALRMYKNERITATEIIRLANRYGVPSRKVMERYMVLFPPDEKAIEGHYQSPEVQQWIA